MNKYVKVYKEYVADHDEAKLVSAVNELRKQDGEPIGIELEVIRFADVLYRLRNI